MKENKTCNTLVWFFHRLIFYIKNRKFPWRYLWIKYFLKGLRYNPREAFQFSRQLKNNGLDAYCFFFHIFARYLVRDATKACRKVGICPFLCFGTLLGYFREGDVIEYDNDIDFGILEEDENKIVFLKQEMAKQGYDIRVERKMMISFMHKKYFNCFVDFWLHRKSKGRDQIYSVSEVPETEGKLVLFSYPTDVFANFRAVRFLGNTVFIPLKTEEYLQLTYGKNWRIPLSKQLAPLSYAEKLKFLFPNHKITTYQELE